jgi:integrase
MKDRRESYQQGTVRRVKRKRGPDVWVFRYRRYMEDGTIQRVAVQLADVIECPSKASAKKKAEDMSRKINEQKVCVYFRDLAKKYDEEVIAHERPHFAQTKRSNMKYLKARWGDERLDEIARIPMHIENWLNGLQSLAHPDQDLSKQTRAHVRNLMHHMMQCADKWGMIKGNPVSVVRVTKGERMKPRKFTVSAKLYNALMNDDKLEHHVKVMIQVAMFTGLSASEFLGLRWEDIDFQALEVHVMRSVVGSHIDETKTPARADVVCISGYLADVLAAWKKHPEYPCIAGWVFGSIRTERPFHEATLQTKHLKPAGERAGVEGLGWHTFRHTWRANLRDIADAPLEIQKQMMRHSSPTMTLKYGAYSEEKKKQMRRANVAVVQKITGTEG